MKYLTAIFCLCAFIGQLMAEEKNPTETSTLFFESGEITAPLSFYTESWDPKQELPIILPGGKHVEEKDLIVSIYKFPWIPEEETERAYNNNLNEGR